jgi:DNA-directed RNA polymerase sigma subunit (sigma70/sigma32)
MSATNIARNADIVASIAAGATFQQMADKYDITRQRAHQIYERAMEKASLEAVRITNHFIQPRTAVESW